VENDVREGLLLTVLPALGRGVLVEPMEEDICREGRLFFPPVRLEEDGRFELTFRLDDLLGRFLLPPDLLILEPLLFFAIWNSPSFLTSG
jgi:hypothetical protein